MHCLFFDVLPRPGHMPHYFEHVERLRPVLAGHEGLIYLERFTPLDAPEALLSHQVWRDETAIRAWRSDPAHRVSQAAGRRVHFERYRIRVGPEVGKAATGDGRFVVAGHGAAPLPGGRGHQSVTRPGRFLTLGEAGTAADARALAHAFDAGGAEEVRVFAITRDYGMTDRAEAPV